MIVDFRMPKLEGPSNAFLKYSTAYVFPGIGPDDLQLHAFVSNYIRLTEASKDHYNNALSHTERYWETSPGLDMGSICLATSYLESCIHNMHRAIKCLIALKKSQDAPQELKSKIGRPKFAKSAVSDRIRDLRNAVAHLEDQVLAGTLPPGAPFALFATGSETPHPDEPTQTVLTLDRVKLSPHEITFEELHAWLTEMLLCAALISEHRNW